LSQVLHKNFPATEDSRARARAQLEKINDNWDKEYGDFDF